VEKLKDELKKLAELEAQVKAGGGAQRVKQQHDSGKLTGRERLDLLFDPGTFQELDMFVRHRCTHFGMEKVSIPADGVITGFGKVNGRTVCAFAQDFTARGGTLGEMHAKKICKVMDLAMSIRAPMVGLIDSGGARIQEGINALDGYGRIFFRNSCASGVIPQISAIMGPAAGGAVYSPAQTDFVFMVKKTSYMYITGPAVVKAATSEVITDEELGGAMTHCVKSGVAQFACENDEQTIAEIKRLLSYLPSSYEEKPPYVKPTDAPDRIDPALDEVIPDESQKAYDMKALIKSIVDNGEFLEPSRLYAPNIITCFARLNGHAVGIIASQPNYLAGCLGHQRLRTKPRASSASAMRFNIPLLTIADVPRLSAREQPGVGAASSATVPSSSGAILRQRCPKSRSSPARRTAGAYIAMCSQALGADYTPRLAQS
jgi:acetyl-CoA carboxylase carboxyltransferase component